MNFAWKCVNYVLSVRVVKTQVMTTRDGSLMSPVGLVAQQRHVHRPPRAWSITESRAELMSPSYALFLCSWGLSPTPRPKGDLRPGALVGVRGLGPGWGAREGDQLPPALLVAPSRGRASAAGPSAGQVRVTPLG